MGEFLKLWALAVGVAGRWAGFRNVRQRNAAALRLLAAMVPTMRLTRPDQQYVAGHLHAGADYLEVGEDGAAKWHAQQSERRAAKALRNLPPRPVYPPPPPSLN